MSKLEEARVIRLGIQAGLGNVERSLQAAAAAEVQLKVQQSTLYAKASSIEERRDELKRLCSRLEEGRNSQNTIIDSTRDFSDQVMQVVSKMQGDYSARLAKVQGSLDDQKAWQEQGSKVCNFKLGDAEKELSETQMGINHVAGQLSGLEASRTSAESTRVSLSQNLTKSQTSLDEWKSYCKQHAEYVEETIQDLQTRRAASQGAEVTDCEVSAWHQGSCSKKCNSGWSALTREVLRHPAKGGAACSTLSATVACNMQPCAKTCQLGAWSEWSQCTSMCNGGHRTRVRTILTAPSDSLLQQPRAVSSASAETAMFDNDEAAACGLTHQVENCNTQTCTDVCVFGEWGGFGPCTKACGGGKRGRRRLKSLANHTVVGAAACSGWQNEFASCKVDQCPSILSCGARQDLVVMVDTSELLTETDFVEQKASVMDLLAYFTLDRENAAVTGLVFYGNGTEGTAALPLVESRMALKQRLDFATRGRGGLNLDKGFDAAKTLFTGWSGRKDVPRTVLVLLEGKPDSYSKSIKEAGKLKDLGIRVVVAVVGSCIVNKDHLEQMASDPATDNLFYFKSHQEFRTLVGTQAVQLCPSLEGGAREALPVQYLPDPSSNLQHEPTTTNNSIAPSVP